MVGYQQKCKTTDVTTGNVDGGTECKHFPSILHTQYKAAAQKILELYS
jgi:hypothetical protein